MTSPLDLPTRCPVCAFEQRQFEDIERHSELFQARTWSFTMYRCNRCLSQFAWPREAAPPEWYAERGEYYGWRWEFDLFLEALSHLRASGQLGDRPRGLEVGCGEGMVLQRLQPWADVLGIEFNQQAADRGRAKGLRIDSTGIVDFCKTCPQTNFHFVALFQVIEHVEDPQALLLQVLGLLEPGGWIFLSTPNGDRYMARIKREAWDYPPHHLVRFSREGLVQLLERTGFEIHKMVTRPMEYADLRAAAHGLYQCVPLPRKLRHVLKLLILGVLFPVAFWMCLRGEGKTLFLAARRL